MSDSKPHIRRINPPSLAQPPGYTHVVDVRASRTIYIAGQVAQDASGQVVGKGDIARQATQVFHNLGAALAAADCTPANVVKFTVFLRDVAHIAAYRAERDRFFAGLTPPFLPASTLVEVSNLASPDFLIEIEAIAVA